MIYHIKRNTDIIASVQAEGTLTRAIMGEEIVAMTFTLPNKVDFKTNDTVEVYGNSYIMLVEPIVEEVNSMEFKYSLNFVSQKYNLAKVQFFFPDKDNNLTISDFSITGTAQQMLELVVQNANRVLNSWVLGTVDVTNGKQINFNGDNCLSAIAKIAEEFDIEYWVDGDKSIHLTERNAISGYTFSYGKGNGLTSVTRTPFNDSTLVTRVYAKGSDKNIPGDYRNYSKNLRMPVPYLEKNIAKYGIIEHTETFEDVYPHREGTVTGVNDTNPLQFTDTGIDFDLNATDNDGNTTILINNVSAKVTFNSGQLAGYTFEIKKNGYNHTTKTFELLKNTDEKDIDVPSELLRPEIGDTYVITDIIMPQSYITAAETLLQQKTQAYLDENSEQRFVYSPQLDRFYLKELNANIEIGKTVAIVAPEFELNANLRVVKLTIDLQDEFDVAIDVAEKAVLSKIVLNYIEGEKQKALLIQQQSYNAQMARRNYLFAQEFHDRVFDGEGYFDATKIKPLSIETKMLTVGSRMQQFNLVDIALTVTNNNTALTNTVGKLVHLTLEDTPREWNIPANSFTSITNEFHYIYVKADKNSTNASFLVSTNQIKVEQDPNFYHFEVGYLSSVIDGVRRIKTTYGFTQVSPSEITTGRISSANGQQYIDLLQDKIKVVGEVQFTTGSDAFNQIATQQDPKINNAQSLAQAHAQALDDAIEIGGRNLIVNSKDKLAGTKSVYNFFKFYNLTEVLEYNQEYVFSFKNNKSETPLIYLWSGSWTTSMGILPNVPFVIPASKSLNVRIAFHAKTPTPFDYDFELLQLEKGNKVTDWSPAPEDFDIAITEAQTEATNASKAYTDAQDSLKETTIKAYADGKVTAEEQARINADTTYLQYAKDFAEAKDDEKETLVKAYADGVATTAEQNAINVAQAKSNLAEANAKAYADGKVTEEEQRAINDAIAKLNEAKAHAQALDDAIEVGGRNLIVSSKDKLVGTKSVYSFFKFYNLTEILEYNQEYVFSFKNNKSETPLIYLWSGSWTTSMGILPNVPFVIPASKSLNVRIAFHAKKPIPFDYDFELLQLEKGNKVTDWSPAPEDVDIAITEVQTEATNALNTANLLDTRTNFLSDTKINGNTIATGTLQVGNSQGANAGITGVGTGAATRFYAGSAFSGRDTAPFRVLDDGSFTSTKGKIGSINIGVNGLGAYGSPIFGLGKSMYLNEEGLTFSRTWQQQREVNGVVIWVDMEKKVIVNADYIKLQYYESNTLQTENTITFNN